MAETQPSLNQSHDALSREEFIDDVRDAMHFAPMATRLTPHILSLIDWSKPLGDPLRRQFIPMKSSLLADHPRLTLDSLNEVDDSPVAGLVHRYPDKVLFLGKLQSFLVRIVESYLTKGGQHLPFAQYIVGFAPDRIRLGLRLNLSRNCASYLFGSVGRRSFPTLSTQPRYTTLSFLGETHSSCSRSTSLESASVSFPCLILRGCDLLQRVSPSVLAGYWTRKTDGRML